MGKNLALGYLLAGLIFILGSCSDQYSICDLEKDAFLKAGLYNVNAGVESLVPVPLFTLKNIGSNNNIYNEQENTSQFRLSLNPVRDSLRFYIKLSQTLPADTLTIVYSTQTIVLSAECGNAFVHNISNSYSTHNSIDSVRVVAPGVTTTSLENLRIFF